MTRDSGCPPQSAQSDYSRDADILASLWEKAPFARLPPDAPAELVDSVQEIENPKRVYAIHRASRRHNFQLLIERYIIQLRYGCGSSSCSTPTCFTCRRRLAGKAPIRRYSATSARTLAVYLASQDNPDNGLCPYVKISAENLGAVNSLILSSKPPIRFHDDPFSRRRGSQELKGSLRRPRSASSPGVEPEEDRSPRTASRSSLKKTSHQEKSQNGPQGRDSRNANLTVTEMPVNTDHRSFAANVFGSVAFKMLEWLTPNSLAAMSQQEQALENGTGSLPSKGQPLEPGATPESLGTETPLLPLLSKTQQGAAQGAERQGPVDSRVLETESGEPKKSQMPFPAASNKGPDRPRRKSSARLRATSNTHGPKKVSIEPLANGCPEGGLSPIPVSPRPNGNLADRISIPIKTGAPKSRIVSDMPPSPFFFDNISPRQHNFSSVMEGSTEKIGVGVEEPEIESEPGKVLPTPTSPVERTEACPPISALESEQPESSTESIPDGVLPQSLTSLSIELIELVSDILQDDGTSESHLLEPPQISRSHFGLGDSAGALRRVEPRRMPYPKRLKKQWKYFIEQSLFNVLSDPYSLIRSFVKDGELLDSHSLWYCMLRLTRVAPSLVFDSLWIAAASLFGAPTSLQALRSPTTKVFRKTGKSLTNAEAGHLMAICLHALMAAAPLVTDSRILHDMSKLRSSGLTVATGASSPQQPAWICLQYNDAFTDELALRLGKRLFSAISARLCFAEMKSLLDGQLEHPQADTDPLQALLSQLDLVSINSAPSLAFSQSERAMHESRASTLLLDWAKTIMLQEWDGTPEVSTSGPLGGALALVATMYEKRQSLLLGDAQFRVDYFADRLDPINMPVAWLSYTSTKQKKHILDFPYIFSPSALVSYFRSINFLRMSRGYEESSSLQTRMKAIMMPSGLITVPHHRVVLQDLLRPASRKFLILEISRNHVVRDAFDQLWQRQERELQRPLKVRLGEEGGEEGFDSGGVQQEFFRLAIAECLNPDFGAFTIDDRTRMTWFAPGSIVPVWKFEVLGLLVSLAVYNGLTLPITFPKALYRKLLGEPVDELHHIADGWPDLANGLTTLLEWDEQNGLVEDVFARTYEFSVSMFGQPISREMNTKNPSWPQAAAATATEESPATCNPEDAPLVTNENRNAYVSDYIRYLTDVSIRPQYEAFSRGFNACLHPKILTLLSPALLQSIVEGTQEIDISELRRNTRYVGWDASHRAIRDFWSIVKRYDDKMKRRLLEFVTASDRVPVGGIQNLQFVLQKNGEEEGEGGHLPTAYTCYGTLLLPEYKDKETLRERLGMALENAQGFGFA